MLYLTNSNDSMLSVYERFNRLTKLDILSSIESYLSVILTLRLQDEIKIHIVKLI